MQSSDTISPASFALIFGHPIQEWHAHAKEKFDKALLEVCNLQLYVEAVKLTTAEHGTQTVDHRIPDHYLSVADARLRAMFEAMEDVRTCLMKNGAVPAPVPPRKTGDSYTSHLEDHLKAQGWFE
jgi:hypothetical protein